MCNKSGYALITVLVFVLVFTLLGAAITRMVTADTDLQINLKHSKQALAAAEAGVQRALSLIANNKLSSSNFYGNLGQSSYNVTIDESNCTIESKGYYRDSIRTIKVRYKKGRDFYSFAINGTFDITDFSSVGKGTNWLDGTTVGVKFIDPDLKAEMQSKNIKVFDNLDLDLPKVADIDISSWKPDVSDCDYGDFNADERISELNLVDNNGDDQIVICGKNIIFDRSLIKFNYDVKIFAEGDITFTRSTTLKKDTGSEVNLTIIAEGKMIFDDNSNIDYAGADSGYNILLYAGAGIESNDTNGQWISISGNQNTDNVSNLFILTPEKIKVNRDLIDDTATTKNDVNFLIWADKGIESSNGGFDISGSSDTQRNFSIIVAEGDVFFDKWQYTGSESRAGFTKELIDKYCEDQDDEIPEFYQNIFCEIKRQIEGQDDKAIRILSWRVE